jgi:hypothetical protein
MERTLICPETGAETLFVPLDHRDVVRPRPASHLYVPVERRILADRDSIETWVDRLRPFRLDSAFQGITDVQVNSERPYWLNGFFNGDDARVLVSMLRFLKPRRYIEIGSGNSTKFARWAIRQWDLRTQITSIDPAPRAEIDSLSNEVIRRSVLDVDLSLFDSCEAGDILFHDGSHITFNGTDTVTLFLEILPRLKKGVMVHIHDINLPWEYVESFDNRGYSEQYILAAALLFSQDWEIVFPNTYLARTGRIEYGGTSFWMLRK